MKNDKKMIVFAAVVFVLMLAAEIGSVTNPQPAGVCKTQELYSPSGARMDTGPVSPFDWPRKLYVWLFG